MKVLSVVGARPQFIKSGPVSAALKARGIEEFLLHTGQHYDTSMSDVFFRELDLRKPDLNLAVGSGSHGAQTAAMLIGIEESILHQNPDWVLVYGDTNSTIAGALAASKLHTPIAHVEAGLRSFNRRMPEEINRIATDAISDLLFAPTEEAVSNLLNEGVSGDRVVKVGDVMYDAALKAGAAAEQREALLSSLGITHKGYILATVHRAENTDAVERLSAIIEGLRLVATVVPVVMPLHPRTRQAIQAAGLGNIADVVQVIEPVGYLDMTKLEMSASAIVTDSGGVQKEAFFHRTPCVTLRAETEWVELVELGWNRLCPPVDSEDIARDVFASVDSVGREGAPYGTGNAADLIAASLT